MVGGMVVSGEGVGRGGVGIVWRVEVKRGGLMSLWRHWVVSSCIQLERR